MTPISSDSIYILPSSTFHGRDVFALAAALFSEYSDTNCLSNLSGLEKWDTSNVEDMREMFFSCSKIKTFSPLSNWNIEKLEYNENMFKGCKERIIPKKFKDNCLIVKYYYYNDDKISLNFKYKDKEYKRQFEKTKKIEKVIKKLHEKFNIPKKVALLNEKANMELLEMDKTINDYMYN